jgi:hypothetical protein
VIGVIGVTTMLDPTRSRHAAKLAVKRRNDAAYRDRCRRHERVARVTFDSTTINTLVRLGALREDKVTNDDAIARAIRAVLDAIKL